MSAMTIRDLAWIVSHHGLILVLVDLDPFALGLSNASVGETVSLFSRPIVMAQLCGGRVATEPMVSVAATYEGLLGLTFSPARLRSCVPQPATSPAWTNAQSATT